MMRMDLILIALYLCLLSWPSDSPTWPGPEAHLATPGTCCLPADVPI